MPIKLGDRDPKIMIGENEIKKVYLGENKIWENAPQIEITYLNQLPSFKNTLKTLKFKEEEE